MADAAPPSDPIEEEALRPPSATLPPVDQFTHPRGATDVIVQVSTGTPVGPTMPVLTVYGDGAVIAGTADGWRSGRISELAIQRLLADAESVGLLDDELVLRRTDLLSSRDDDTATDPDITVLLAVNGRTLVHQLDLARIERPPSIRAFLSEATIQNRFALTEPFEPTTWIACTIDGCDIVADAVDAASRPVLPGENPSDLAAP
ncbi:MAG TPA: hypothetical protein VK853_08750 [Ilumatobacteraceae bacterium]|nr:hypothetical protein [Ilumatobacteraceae bacterium]